MPDERFPDGVKADGEDLPPISAGPIETRLDTVIEILTRAYPLRPIQWYERVYGVLQTLLKYVGIPALVLASVAPVISAFEGYREYRNKKYLNATYAQCAEDLLSRGSVERARALMTDLEAAEKRDVRAQYMFAKVATMEAIKRGRNYQEAEDRANVLLRLHQNRDWLFPAFGGASEVADLQLALADIHIQLGRYAQAEQILKNLAPRPVPASTLAGRPQGNALLDAEILLRYGTMAVLRYQFPKAIGTLIPAAAVFGRSHRSDLSAEAEFQLAKAYQFAYQPDNALRHYELAKRSYLARQDDWGLLKVYNNVGMIYFDRHDLEQASYYYSSAEKTARSLGDQLGIARAVTNLSILEKERGHYPGAEKKALEALEAFRLADNKLGMAAAYQSLANLAFLRQDTASAVHNGEQAAAIFRAEGELRGLSDALGLISQAVEHLDDQNEQVFYNAFAYILRRHIGKPEQSYNHGVLLSLRRQMPGVAFYRAWDLATSRIRATLREMNAIEVSVDPPADLAQVASKPAA